jgi:hypothetical protein
MSKAVLAVVNGGLLREQTAFRPASARETRRECSDIGLSQVFCRDGLEFVKAQDLRWDYDDTPFRSGPADKSNGCYAGGDGGIRKQRFSASYGRIEFSPPTPEMLCTDSA